MEFLLQPGVYSTGSTHTLLSLLDKMWLKTHSVGDGTLYIISGFSNYNGGVRFLPYFAEHIHKGGKIKVVVGGSTAQRLSSLQIVEALLECGAEVYVVNRKRLVHAKCYGFSSSDDTELVVTSGNFTGPGMSQNAEAALLIEADDINSMGFSWDGLFSSILNQEWDVYQLDAADIGTKADPGWKLLYDEVHGAFTLEEDQKVTMVITLSHSDTARIQADPGTNASKGTQYFWLSKGCFDFFPALTIPNNRGVKNTFSCMINMNYIDLGSTIETRVTFEADNNLDFRLGTGPLRGTKIADEKDIALITRLNEYDYEMRIIRQSSDCYNRLLHYAINYIGNQGKRFGYINNEDLWPIIEHMD